MFARLMYTGVSRKHAVLLFACVLFLAAGAAAALDVDDVKELMRNQVPEQVIVNMIRNDGSMYITPEEADEFRALGASENLIAELRERPNVAEPMAPSPVVVAAPSPVVTTTVPQAAAMPAAGSPVLLAPVVSSSSYPPRYDKEGWLSISNRDWVPYYITINRGDKRIFISKVPNGGISVQSGENVFVNLRKETYKMYGDSGKSLSVKVRENETTTLSLNPFGVFGNSGLSGVVTDRDRVRSEILFDNYSPPPPTIIVREPPVIIAPGPRPPVYRHYGGHDRRRHGGGASFRFSW